MSEQRLYLGYTEEEISKMSEREMMRAGAFISIDKLKEFHELSDKWNEIHKGMSYENRYDFAYALKEMPQETVYDLMKSLDIDISERHFLSEEELKTQAETLEITLDAIEEIKKDPSAHSMDEISRVTKNALKDLFEVCYDVESSLFDSYERVKQGNIDRNEAVREATVGMTKEVLILQGSSERSEAERASDDLIREADIAITKLENIKAGMEKELARVTQAKETLHGTVEKTYNAIRGKVALGASVVGMAVGVGLQNEAVAHGVKEASTLLTMTYGTMGAVAGATLAGYLDAVKEQTGKVFQYVQGSVEATAKTRLLVEDYRDNIKSLIERNAQDRTEVTQEDALTVLSKKIEAKIEEAEQLKQNKPSFGIKDYLFQREMISAYRESYAELKQEISSLKNELKTLTNEIKSMNAYIKNEKEKDKVSYPKIIEVVRDFDTRYGKIVGELSADTKEITQSFERTQEKSENGRVTALNNESKSDMETLQNINNKVNEYLTAEENEKNLDENNLDETNLEE